MKTNETTPIPQGYKATPLGIIPQEWEIYDFDRIVIRSQSHYLPNPQIHLRCIELEHLSQGDGSILGYIDSAEQKSMKNEFEEGDVLFGKLRPYLRKYWLAKFRGVCSTEIWVLRAISDVCTKEYLFDIISSYNFVQKANVSSGSKMPRAEWDYVSKIPILTPPLAEQRKIAEVLGLWDKAIEKQSQLIEQLTLRKRGLMQQLLTAKRRLPGFSGPWKTFQIKDFAFEINLRNKDSIVYEVLSCTKYEGLVSSLEYFGKQIYSEDLSSYKIVPRNCFAYATNHIEEGSIGYQLKYNNALISPMYTVFGTDSKCVDDVFLYKLLKTQRLIYLYKSHMEGSIDRRGGLRWKDFSIIKLAIPSIIEQTAIAQVLTAADREIELAQQKLELLRQQKRGLMQQLLTGKKRVKY